MSSTLLCQLGHGFDSFPNKREENSFTPAAKQSQGAHEKAQIRETSSRPPLFAPRLHQNKLRVLLIHFVAAFFRLFAAVPTQLASQYEELSLWNIPAQRRLGFVYVEFIYKTARGLNSWITLCFLMTAAEFNERCKKSGEKMYRVLCLLHGASFSLCACQKASPAGEKENFAFTKEGNKHHPPVVKLTAMQVRPINVRFYMIHGSGKRKNYSNFTFLYK